MLGVLCVGTGLNAENPEVTQRTKRKLSQLKTLLVSAGTLADLLGTECPDAVQPKAKNYPVFFAEADVE